MKLLQAIFEETGLRTLFASSADIKVLCLQRLVRLFAYGSTTLVLALFLSDLDISDRNIGIFMTVTLWGDAILSSLLTLVADRIGRRCLLALGSLLMVASGMAFATADSYWILLVASVFGVISPSGSEIGPFKAIEESSISQLATLEDRNTILAWYYVLGTWGSAAGALTCGWIVEKLQSCQWTRLEAYRVVFWAYAVMGATKCALSLMLSTACECEREQKVPPIDFIERPIEPGEADQLLHEESTQGRDQSYGTTLIARNACVGENLLEHNTSTIESDCGGKHTGLSPTASASHKLIDSISTESRWLLLKICLLFAFDNLGSGVIPESWQIFYFARRFSMGEGPIGSLFFTSRIVSSVSNIFAIPIVRRIGLIPTMVTGNIPAAILLGAIPFGPSSSAAASLLVLRACFLDIDQAPRQAFLGAAFLPAERTAVLGIINVVRTLCQSLGPSIAGSLAGVGKLWCCFVIAMALKLTYNALLSVNFWRYRTREEKRLCESAEAKAVERTTESGS